MDEDEASLLAELRAISNRSAQSRFDDDGDGNNNVGETNDHDGQNENNRPDNATTIHSSSNRLNPASTESPKKPPPRPSSRASSTRPGQQRSPSPATRRSPSPAIRRTSSPAPGRTPSPATRRAPSPATRRTPSPAIRRESPGRKASPAGARSPPVKPPAKKKDQSPSSNRNGKPPVEVDRVEAERRKLESKQQSSSSGPVEQRGIKSDLPSTFQGERGGTAEDAELLAELRKISAKSGGASRFSDEGEVGASEHGTSEEASEPMSSSSQPPSNDELDSEPSETYNKIKNDDPVEQTNYGIKSDLPNTFTGDRGGTAEDEELLAELRAISSKSGASNRFVSDEGGIEEPPPSDPAPPSRVPSKRAGTPPWKRKKAAPRPVNKQEDSVVVAAPKPPSVQEESKNTGFKSALPNTFQGERGGAAEDDELLAELRAISNKPSSADRFRSEDSADDTNTTTNNEQPVVVGEKSPPRPNSKRDPNAVPPWKRNGSNNRKAGESAGPRDSQKKTTTQPSAASVRSSSPKQGGFKSDLPNTFNGDRGGFAEDAELLAELRAISSKSGVSSRFASDEGDVNGQTENAGEEEEPARLSQNDDHIPDATGSAESSHNAEPVPSYGIKSSLPNTFSGDRGGEANDEELLAELRAISSKSGASNRFDGSVEGGSMPEPQQPPPSSKTSAKSKRDTTPPWKRKNKVASKPAVEPSPVPSQPPVEESRGFGIKSDIPSTFKGDRGGPAEDAELLAELRAISAGSGSSRFASEDNMGESARAPPRERRNEPATAPARTPVQPPPRPTAPTVVDSVQPKADGEQPELSEENLPGAIVSKDWKMRVQAFELLNNKLRSLAGDDEESLGQIDGSSVMDDLDAVVTKIAEDANAGALDKALELLITYAECCRRGGEADQARSIVQSLVKKNALSSRPTTLKLANDLALKLIEVGANGSDSAHAVVEVLIKEGLKSKKPKVVQASGSLIHIACLEFGVSILPLHSVEAAIPQILSNPNAKVREIGLNILAELCRTLSKDSFQKIIDQMKSAQVAELDDLLAKQPEATPPKRRLRGSSGRGKDDGTEGSDMPAMPTNAAELQAQRYAARPAVNLMNNLAKTDYAQKIGHQKWSEKVAALKCVIEAGGEQPFKLAQPSPTNNYIPLISEMKQLLKHTHFAVVSKAMEVIAMLSEGVGERLFPQLRPVLPTLLKLSKDKKLTKAVGGAVDALFGNVLSFDHLLDSDDAVPSAVNEKQEKNALARTASLDFLVRCINRNSQVGSRSDLSPSQVSSLLSLAVEKLDDSDAGVRKEAMNIFQALKALNNPEFDDIVDNRLESLKSTHARAYKTITGTGTGSSPSKSTPQSSKQRVPSASSMGPGEAANRAAGNNGPSPTQRKVPSANRQPAPDSPKRKAPTKRTVSSESTKGSGSNGVVSAGSKYPQIALEDALEHMSQLGLNEWDLPEDDSGVLAGLSASKWTLKNDAIKTLSSFVETGQVDSASDDTIKNSSSILCVTKEHTRGFKETNLNIMKTILQLFCEVCAYHESSNVPLMEWAMIDGVSAAVLKIQDRKLSDSCSQVLSSLCIVCQPSEVLTKAITAVDSIKSPLAHENLLRWFTSFFKDFGANSIGQSISEILPWLIKEIGTSNPKVKKEASNVIGEIHCQLGPSFKALAMQLSAGSNQDLLEQACDANPYDPSESKQDRPKQSICNKNTATDDSGTAAQGFALELPKTDIGSLLGDGVIPKLNSKDGKAAWKMRKEAIEEVSAALKSCNGLLDSAGSKLKFLVDLSRALKERMTDTQINLRPLAARTIGDILSKVDQTTQSRLGKVLYPVLVNSSMHDIKKPVRDAAIEAINLGARLSVLEGSELNNESLEVLFATFANEFNDTALRSTGLADLLACLEQFVESLPNFTEIIASQGSTLGERFAKVLIECLSSSKSEVRSASFSLIERSIQYKVITASTCHQVVDTMKPAKQRSVAPLIAKLEKPNNQKLGEKENLPSTSSAKTSATTSEVPSVAKGSISSQGSLVGRRGSIGRPDQPSQSSSIRRGSIGRQDSTKQSAKLQMPRSMPLPPSHTSKKETQKHVFSVRTGKNVQPKQVAWPPFPEEPNNPIYMNLKRAWGPALPGPSAAKLFPVGGIKKQDDAKEACELLEQAIEDDAESGTSDLIESHLDCLLKWISFVLCCKEAPVGLQSLLSLIQKLFDVLIQNNRGLSEDEVGVLVPFLIEKTSNAKGRFRDIFMDILDQLRSEALVSPKILGPVACIQVIERSNQAKARALAFSICRECVMRAGLPGVGKKGVVAAAKSLSDEQLPETKSAGLDLMDEILRRMNGDVSKLAKICGSALSRKATEAVEEHWKKSGSKKELLPESKQTPRKPVERSLPVTPDRKHIESTPGSERSAKLQDELPAFNLRSTLRENDYGEYNFDRSKLVSADPFVFSHSASSIQEEIPFQTESGVAARHDSRSRLLQDPVEFARDHPHDDSESIRSINTTQTSGTLGTAASLRARLLKIKEKNRVPETERQNSQSENDFDDMTAVSAQGDGREEYKLVVNHVKALLRRSVPLDEDDADILTATRSLKKVHTALANSTENATEGSSRLKNILVDNLSGLISQLVRVIRFSLDCLEPSNKAGISIPLLSVSLATLMALFRFSDVASRVTVDDLTLLIRETATILLDPRFSSESELDDVTCAQMAKAINKTAVNAATGASRYTAYQALIAVQRQLADEVGVSDEDEFNGRLSRVILRLFMRVIKFEEGVEDPYSPHILDMQSLVCTMDQTLKYCKTKSGFAIDACKDMVLNLTESILKVSGSFEQLRKEMEIAAISTSNSPLAELIFSLDPGEKLGSNGVAYGDVQRISEKTDVVRGPSIAELVTALGNSKEGHDRDVALTELRRHKEKYGSLELNAYLEDVSPAFRKFIEDQMAAGVSSSPTNSEGSNSMSERLRKLRSRLQATEEQIIQPISEDQEPPPQLTTEKPSPRKPGPLSISTVPTPNNSGPSRSSRLAQPSPRSRLPQSSPSRRTSTQSGLALPSPSKLSKPSASDRQVARSYSGSMSSDRTTAAANLRARLEAVKQGKK